jgi:hypothetical protein
MWRHYETTKQFISSKSWTHKEARTLIPTSSTGVSVSQTPQIQTVDYEKGFHFFNGSGNYEGETATSLVTFEFILESISVDSIRYHMGRGDFQKWIREVLCDDTLAEKIDNIRTDVSDQQLRSELIDAVNQRLKGTTKKQLE